MKINLPPKPPNPCKKDCPDRSATCHSECAKYREFHAWNLRYYDAKLREAKSNEASRGQAARETEKSRRKWQTHNYKYKN